VKIFVSITFLHFAFVFFAKGQTTCQKAFGGINNDSGFDVIATSDGGYAMAGSSDSYTAGNLDALLIKMDAYCNIQWKRIYGGTGNEHVLQLVQTQDGGFVLAGKTSSYGSGDYDAMLMKTDSTGNLLWMKAYGGAAEERILNIRETTDHGFILAGSTLSFGQGDYDMLFIRTDSTGDTLWTKILGGPAFDQGTDADQTSDGGFILSGRAMSWGAGNCDVFLAKTDANGDTLWTRVFGSAYWDEGMKVKQTTDGGYIVTGASVGFTNLSYDAYLNKIDTTGHVTWSKLYSGTSTDATYDVLQLSDGGYIIIGETESFGNNHHRLSHPVQNEEQRNLQPGNHTLGTDHSNVLTIRTDASGDTLWCKTYGGVLMDEAYAVIQTPDSGFMIAAYTTSFGNDTIDFYLIRTDSSGFSGCYETPAPVAVSSPPTIEANTTAMITSGLTVTVAAGAMQIPSIVQHDLCFLSTGTSEMPANPGSLLIYPNPCHGHACIQLPDHYATGFVRAEVFISDVFGREIMRCPQQGLQKISIPIENIAAGVYEVKLIVADQNKPGKTVWCSKLMVE